MLLSFAGAIACEWPSCQCPVILRRVLTSSPRTESFKAGWTTQLINSMARSSSIWRCLPTSSRRSVIWSCPILGCDAGTHNDPSRYLTKCHSRKVLRCSVGSPLSRVRYTAERSRSSCPRPGRTAGANTPGSPSWFWAARRKSVNSVRCSGCGILLNALTSLHCV